MEQKPKGKAAHKRNAQLSSDDAIASFNIFEGGMSRTTSKRQSTRSSEVPNSNGYQYFMKHVLRGIAEQKIDVESSESELQKAWMALPKQVQKMITDDANLSATDEDSKKQKAPTDKVPTDKALKEKTSAKTRVKGAGKKKPVQQENPFFQRTYTNEEVVRMFGEKYRECTCHLNNDASPPKRPRGNQSEIYEPDETEPEDGETLGEATPEMNEEQGELEDVDANTLLNNSMMETEDDENNGRIGTKTGNKSKMSGTSNYSYSFDELTDPLKPVNKTRGRKAPAPKDESKKRGRPGKKNKDATQDDINNLMVQAVGKTFEAEINDNETNDEPKESPRATTVFESNSRDSLSGSEGDSDGAEL